MNRYDNRLHILTKEYDELISRENEKILPGNGVFERYKYPILTADHPPLEWRYDFNPETNPYLMERFGINAVFNAGAIKFNGKYLVMARVEGHDRKSFFAIAESPNGIDNFRFWEYPVQLPDLYPEETNVYDMRLTKHEDGYTVSSARKAKIRTHPQETSLRPSQQQESYAAGTLKTGNACPTSSPKASNGMWCCTQSS